ncbi:hypothetical protein A2856_03035 [Candidatus Uhrbacteria bacterium RIFCSPHIGHO2_01_FULL_63_20]|uniref:Thymidylate kinase n=1 Tax=Candidatus Uhrbacteria bacterium RIFCSPHIGHO2_01_FULL_63_20 TaxID=1802385 RepID=A0A1F7TMD7_9BACT|nr:MAG: hypothetical protein A2856_03035 [Candidatus Uhrbacteria bacterium RIFCSPHIGHO2_01_FULL_63_20]
MPRFIVIDGTDGAGKKTQTELLIARMRREGLPVHSISFPRYGKPSAYFVEKFLRGGFGPASDSFGKRASIFYALDRFDAAPEIRQAMMAGTHVVTDRYVASNMGHQGSYIKDRAERDAYFAWNDELEHEIMGIPRPDLNLVLHVPADIAIELKRQAGAKDGKTGLDIVESDIEYLRNGEECYLDMAARFPRFRLIECMDGDRLLSKEEVHELIWKNVSEFFLT